MIFLKYFPLSTLLFLKQNFAKHINCSFNMWCLITPSSCSNAVSLPSHRTAESFWRESFGRAWLISCHWASINPALTTSDNCPPALNTTATLLLILQNSGYQLPPFESFHNRSRQPIAFLLFNNFRVLIPSVKS